ncbi:P-loop containing nucleoside triphosphate hydrolase protein [Hypoxylon sp. FL1150]|nr:P-loop containing nucleoside triphosphate hydrolase protein [Hypoxylon sp. FL1150]
MPRPSDFIVVTDDDVTQSSGSDEPVTRTSAKRKLPPEVISRLESSDGDLDDWNHEAFKKRKKETRKSSTRGKGKGKGKATARGRPRKGITADKIAARQNDDSASESDPEGSVPGYIRDRRQQFDHNRRVLREGGLRLPPDYSDIYFSDDERLATIEEKPQFDPKSGIKPCRLYRDIVLEHSAGVIPASIAQYLRDYQIEGVKFLHHLFVYQKGGILGDDMGLGKTVQVAAFLSATFGKTGDRRDAKRMRKFQRAKSDWYPRALIICPGSIIQNWKNEMDRWGWWGTDLYHGAGKDDVLGAARAGRLEIMITTYTTYKNNRDQVNRIPWDVVVADECHSIKDVKAEVTKAMNELNALCRIGLTGTAIQNRYEELWALLNWTNPGQFGTLGEWKNTICKPLTIGQSHDATIHQLSEARKTAKKLRFNLLPRFFLRRMKTLIADQLPKKTDRVVFCPLSDLQREAYENILASDLVDFVRNAHEPCPCGSSKAQGWCCFKENEDGDSWRSLVFPIMITLQKLSNHFNLLMPRSSDLPDKHQREFRFLQAATPLTWQEHYNGRDSLLSLANPEYCGKWKVLRRLLKFWHTSGDKVLVFSHSVRLLKILQLLFNNTSYTYSYLDGSLAYEERQQVVDDFNSDPNQFVFLISTKAGGVGLNITSANKVVIMDPHWNPSYDLQAQDRAYRIGQVRDVEVYRLIAAGTIEETTYARQIYKQQQANIGYNASNERRYFKGVQQDSERKGEIFGMQNLLTYHGDQIVLRDIVNKTNIAEAKAGVKLIDIDMDKAAEEADDDGLFKREDSVDDETGGLKQLSTLLTKSDSKEGLLKPTGARKPKNFDPIQAILASEGVEYTHDNSEVVGSSKVEDELSRQAEMVLSQDADPEARALFFASLEASAATSVEYEYNPPLDVRRRQFCTMAKTFGFSSVTEFALAVESMSQEEQRNCLQTFYKKRGEKLKHLGESDSDTDTKLVHVKTEDTTAHSVAGVKGDTENTDTEDFETEDVKPTIPVVEQEVEVTPLSEGTCVKENRSTKLSRASMTIFLSDDETDEL